MAWRFVFGPEGVDNVLMAFLLVYAKTFYGLFFYVIFKYKKESFLSEGGKIAISWFLKKDSCFKFIELISRIFVLISKIFEDFCKMQQSCEKCVTSLFF